MRTVSKRQARITAANAHAHYTWECICGKICRGNGGKSSHKKACIQWRDRDLVRREPNTMLSGADRRPLELKLGGAEKT